MIGQPFNPNNCLFVANQSLNANQFNAVPNASNQSNHTVLWDFVSNKIYWVNTLTNIIEREIDGSGGIQNEAYEKISVNSVDGYYFNSSSFSYSQPEVYGDNYLLLPAGTYTFELEWDMFPPDNIYTNYPGILKTKIRTNTNQSLTNVDASDVIQQECTIGLSYSIAAASYPLEPGFYNTANQTLGTGAATFNTPFIVKSSFETVYQPAFDSTICYFNNIQLRALLVK